MMALRHCLLWQMLDRKIFPNFLIELRYKIPYEREIKIVSPSWASPPSRASSSHTKRPSMDIYLISASHRYQWFLEKRHISQWVKVNRSHSHCSEVFERIIYNQINEYIYISKVLIRFRKNHNTQHSLLKMLKRN